MNTEDLISKVAEKTHGTAGDPLTLDEVGLVVRATLKELKEAGWLVPTPDESS